MKTNRFKQTGLLMLITIMATFFSAGKAPAKDKTNYTRMANITVDRISLDKYRAALKNK